MGKLIDGDKLISTLVWGHYGLGKQLQTVQQAINDMRGEDAVPVIRCRDCKYAKKIYAKNLPWLKQWEYSCRYFNTHSVMGDGFCSQAEPKESKNDTVN